LPTTTEPSSPALITPSEAAGVIDPRTQSPATKFAQDHNWPVAYAKWSKKASSFPKLGVHFENSASEAAAAATLAASVNRRSPRRFLGFEFFKLVF
jgi:hypothetical protein